MVILLKKNRIEQTDAINQIAIANSDNIDITILNNPIENIQYLMRKGRLIDAADLVVETLKKAKQMHPLYPKYSYKTMELGSDILFVHEPSSREISDLYPLHYKGKMKIIDSNLVNQDIDDYFAKKYFMQEKIKINIEYLEAWIGEELIDDLGEFSFEQYAIKNAEWYMIPQNLPKPIETKLFINVSQQEYLISNLELNVTGVSKSNNEIEISNLHQHQSPIIISIKLCLKKNGEISSNNKAKFNFRIRESFEKSVIAEKKFLEFMKYSSLQSQIKLINALTNDVIFIANDFSFENLEKIDYIDEKLLILNDLLEIEEKLNINFIMPSEMRIDDFNKIQLLKSLVNQEEAISSLSELSILVNDRTTLNMLINEIESSKIRVKFTEQIEIELFGVKVTNIIGDYEINNVTVQNIDKLKNKFEYYDDGDNIKVTFETSSKNNVKTNYYIS